MKKYKQGKKENSGMSILCCCSWSFQSDTTIQFTFNQIRKSVNSTRRHKPEKFFQVIREQAVQAIPLFST
ncbi:hypothetical protein MTR_2g437050 [Medicago truncatula]|uniref:Uncharacterized protein n=1 Tax=Medicago truncatula TaxID=3880 RepID=A0A072V7G5_MEDTR|nr:hypothetical protein MTR_2g437050 [Medicago truncatula]